MNELKERKDILKERKKILLWDRKKINKELNKINKKLKEINEEYRDNESEQAENEELHEELHGNSGKRKRKQPRDIVITDSEDGSDTDDIGEGNSEPKLKRIKKKLEIEELLEEDYDKEPDEIEEINWEVIEEGITKLYSKLCEWEETLFDYKRKMMEKYYNFGREFEKKLCSLKGESFMSEKTIISKMYKEIQEKNVGSSMYTIRKRVEKSRKIYLLVFGGKRKINKLKRLNSEDYIGFSFEEIKEWVGKQENV